ncbi:MAG: GGDEF domain-containing protein [Deltaproteobacteria bacterium]|nr:GGDEF domain-containing protein [Deltaproteobacteria bacterium]
MGTNNTEEEPLEDTTGKSPVCDTTGESPTMTAPQATLDDEQAPRVPTLIVQSGPNIGDYFVFPQDKESIIVGRGRDSDFRIPDTSVSRNHARFREVPGVGDSDIRVNDLGSTNGTLIQGMAVEAEITVCDGDVLQLGDVTIRYRRMDPTDRAFQEEIASKVENARTDPLTGLNTRRYLDDYLSDLVAAHERNARAISVLMIDLDHFKQVNDGFGHAIGDQVLQDVSQLIQTAIRSGDTAVRYGGEEFCVVLPGASEAIALRVAERIRSSTETSSREREGRAPKVTVSIGAATLAPNEDAAHWLERADAALYIAKRDGRNRVVNAAPGTATFEVETVPAPGGFQDRDTHRVLRVDNQTRTAARIKKSDLDNS